MAGWHEVVPIHYPPGLISISGEQSLLSVLIVFRVRMYGFDLKLENVAQGCWALINWQNCVKSVKMNITAII